nr:hypothetical protein GCM10025699_07650 [Microbacterium flavescens]
MGVGVFGVSPHTQNVSPLTLLAPPEPSSVTQHARLLAVREHPPHSAHHFSRSAITALVAGVLVAVLTTRDPLWWQLHFSQLGTFDDFSAHVFNSTAIIAGFLLATYGVVVVTVLPRTTPASCLGHSALRWSRRACT